MDFSHGTVKDHLQLCELGWLAGRTRFDLPSGDRSSFAERVVGADLMDGEQQRFVVDDLDVGHVRLDLDRPGGNQLTAREGVRHDDVRVAGSKNLVPTLIIISLSGGGIAQRYRSRYSPTSTGHESRLR